MATPSGRVQCQPKKWNGTESMFCATKISNTMRIRKPPISAVHRAPARVNLTAGSTGALPGTGVGAVLSALSRGSGSSEAEGLLLMVPSLSHPAQKETNHAGNLVAHEPRTAASRYF